MALDRIKKGFSKFLGKGDSEEYLEIDLGEEVKKNKILIKPFILKKFDDVNEILNTLREGYTIAVIDIRQLRQKDIIELKRSIAKIKKTVEALDGEVAGFGENVILATPSFAEIHKQPKVQMPQQRQGFEGY